jgi:hypothetical protein
MLLKPEAARFNFASSFYVGSAIWYEQILGSGSGMGDRHPGSATLISKQKIQFTVLVLWFQTIFYKIHSILTCFNYADMGAAWYQ